ncbi:glycoside hydrolase family 3 N-terminal domain-containing protein [Novosphingobium rhizosphaerae]|uniref:glycoside hydrolase family 3 N-terminal domain-containing protein n=1 Tax=Novosphingobium rhizosphaerae TaxID=1551649 RepID=UPI0018594AF2
MLKIGTCLSGVMAAGPALALSRELYRDPAAPIEARVKDLVSRMTLDEKIAQLRSLWFGKSEILGGDGTLLPAKAKKAIEFGIGQIARPGDWAGTSKFGKVMFRSPESAMSVANDIQRFHVEQTRLGIPTLFHEEAAHGLMASEATIFPSPPALGSTWDRQLVEQVFTVAAREARLRGAHVALCPVIDLARDPRFGRVEEFFGEDPRHVAEMGKAAVFGLQGRKRPIARDRVYATLKHFIHGTPAAGLNIAPFEVGERTLRSTYLLPFEHVIRDADPAIVMPSYNLVAGVPAHANKELLIKTGRGRLGFKGAYFSDYMAVTNLASQHHMAANDEDAAVIAINAGIDAELPDGTAYAHLAMQVRSGRVSEARIDEAVGHVLRLKFEAGLFETPYVDPKMAARATNTAADIRLARLAAQKAVVLLRNDGVLPLDPKAAMRLAVIGPNANEPMFGGYSGTNSKSVGVLDGLRAAAGERIEIAYHEGVRILKPDPAGEIFAMPVPEDPAANAARIAEAVSLAKRSDMVLLVLGDRPEITREAIMANAPGDRNTLDLFGDQNALVEAMLQTGKPIIALLLNGRALTVNTLAERANALIEGWYLGQEGGHAIADIIFGKANPGGKLAVTFPRAVGDIPISYDHQATAEVNRYVEGEHKPLFPFGFGLSYTRFECSPPRLSRSTIAPSDNFNVEVDVANTGTRAGDEVVQLYIHDLVSSVPRPVLELKGFERITLQPGERRTVSFALGPDDLAFWDIDMQWRVEPGEFAVHTGNSSADLKSAQLTVS